MTATSVPLSTLIDGALLELQAPAEQGHRVALDGAGLTSGAVTFMLTDGSAVNISDLIEFGSELVLVTGKSNDTVPVFTCSRGYFQTTQGTHLGGTPGLVNPQYPRVKVAAAVKRAFPRMEALGVPLVKSGSFNTTGLAHVLLPDDVRRVNSVRFVGTWGNVIELDRWRYQDSMPTSKYPSGKILSVGSYVADSDSLEITYRAAYRWSSFPNQPAETDTIDIPEGAEDLPSSYAAAWLVSSREISRSELDRSEEWNRTSPLGPGSGVALARSMWQAFYRSLDEARRLNPEIARRPYVPMPKVRF